MRIGSDRNTLSHREIRGSRLFIVFDRAESRENPFYASPHRRLPMSLLLDGGLVVTQDEQRRVVSGDVLLEDGRIVAVGDVDRSAENVIDCSGCVVLPGFINLHQHVANTLLRGVADDVPLEEMLPKASAIDAKLTRRDVQIGALLGCVEMIRSGTTSFQIGRASCRERV